MSSNSTPSYEPEDLFKKFSQEFSKSEAEHHGKKQICPTTNPTPLPERFIIDLTPSLTAAGIINTHALLHGTIRSDGVRTHGSWTSDSLTAHGGRIQDDSGYYITDENTGEAGGTLALNAHNGDLSVSNTPGAHGEVFIKVWRKWIKNAAGEKIGEVFSLQSSTNTKMFLALDTNSKYFAVKGMTAEQMIDISNSYWRHVPFKDIGPYPPGSGYFALQYWGNYFGSPSSKEYFFVIEDKTTFKLAPAATAAKHGRLGIIPQ